MLKRQLRRRLSTVPAETAERLRSAPSASRSETDPPRPAYLRLAETPPVAEAERTAPVLACIPEVVAREELEGIRLVVDVGQVDGFVEVLDGVFGVLDEPPGPDIELPEDERDEGGRETGQCHGCPIRPEESTAALCSTASPSARYHGLFRSGGPRRRYRMPTPARFPVTDRHEILVEPRPRLATGRLIDWQFAWACSAYAPDPPWERPGRPMPRSARYRSLGPVSPQSGSWSGGRSG